MEASHLDLHVKEKVWFLEGEICMDLCNKDLDRPLRVLIFAEILLVFLVRHAFTEYPADPLWWIPVGLHPCMSNHFCTS